ncbi:MAG: dihydropteroate synthase [Clostridia bacterium]|nr:dihydropteroate synthase [Clostridia bacterium]
MIFNTNSFRLDLSGQAGIMAVINLTPDSFYADSRHSADSAAEYAAKAQAAGAAVIDLGAQSTAPQSTPITAEEELQRLITPLREVRKAVSIPISVDTYFPQVARAALENGADIINDVSGTASEEMALLAAQFGAGWIVMHTGGLKSNQTREDTTDIIDEINSFFAYSLNIAESCGLPKENICFDPGIGFGKSREDDLKIIADFAKINPLGCTKLAALSRKRVTKLCGDALTGTIVANAACIAGGANLIRVHDIEQAVATAQIAKLLAEAKNG